MEKLVLKERTFKLQKKERMMNPGQNSIFLTLKNDSYKGFDRFVKI